MDVLLLLFEESKYADRIRRDLSFREIKREPLIVKGKQRHYNRPKSRTTIISSTILLPESSKGEQYIATVLKREERSNNEVFRDRNEDDGQREYTNPSIDMSRRVNESEALYTKGDVDLKYTLSDLQLAAKGKKKISVRDLRALANRLGIDSTMKKPDLIRHIISAYRRRISDISSRSRNKTSLQR